MPSLQSPSLYSPKAILKSSLKECFFLLASLSNSPPNSLQNTQKIGVTLFDWLSYILPWLFHFKSYASRQQRTVNTGNEFIKIVLRYFCFVVFPIKNKLVTMIVIYHITN